MSALVKLGRAGHRLAELNAGRLPAPTDDPGVAEFMAALDRVNGLGKRMPGFVRMMAGSGAPDQNKPGVGNTGARIAGDSQHVSILTVWTDVKSLAAFVWNTVHREFYERRKDWFQLPGQQHFVMWSVPEGHRPAQDEALARLEHLRGHGPSDAAFDWAWLKEARLWQQRQCAAE